MDGKEAEMEEGRGKQHSGHFSKKLFYSESMKVG